MSIDLVFWIIAAICWGLCAFGVNTGRVNTWYLGWMLVALTFVF
jgi:hypothetical protein